MSRINKEFERLYEKQPAVLKAFDAANADSYEDRVCEALMILNRPAPRTKRLVQYHITDREGQRTIEQRMQTTVADVPILLYLCEGQYKSEIENGASIRIVHNEDPEFVLTPDKSNPSA